MVHNIHIMEEMRLFLYILSDSYGKLNIKKNIELVYQLQLFSKKIILTSFKTRDNAFVMR